MDDEEHLSRIQTLWSVVRQAHDAEDSDAFRAAQQALLDRYGGAVRRYALAALRDEDQADEVFQEFALRFVRGDFGKADPERGRFRAFVKTAVYRMIIDQQRRQRRQGQQGALPDHLAEPAEELAGLEDDALFHKSWREELLARTWAKLESLEQQTSKPYHTALRYRADHPDLRSPELAEGVGKQLGKPLKPGAMRVLLHRAREQFAELLLDEVVESLADGSLEQAEEELIDLDLLEYCRPAFERRNASGKE